MDRRRWLLAAAVAVAIVVTVIVFWDRIGPDFWPLDSSRVGPNLLASLLQWALVLVAVTLLYPPWRRAVHRFLDNKLASVHGKLDAIRVFHHRHNADLARLHDKLDKVHERNQQSDRKMKALHETVNVLAANHAELHESVKSIHEKIDAQGKGRKSSS